MADMFIDKTSAVLTKTLDGSALRQSVLADNIANVDTPGFTRREVSFEHELQEIAERYAMTPDQVLSEVEQMAFAVEDDVDSPRRADGNNVNVEHEMAQMAKNSLQYDVTAQMLMMKFRALKLAIREGR